MLFIIRHCGNVLTHESLLSPLFPAACEIFFQLFLSFFWPPPTTLFFDAAARRKHDPNPFSDPKSISSDAFIDQLSLNMSVMNVPVFIDNSLEQQVSSNRG